MKFVEAAFSIFLAMGLAAGTTMLVSEAGYGAAGVLIFGSILTTAIFSLLGGRLRVLLAFIAVAPPFSVVTFGNYSSVRESLPVWEALRHIFPGAAMGFCLIVAPPVFLVWIVYHLTYRRAAESGADGDKP